MEAKDTVMSEEQLEKVEESYLDEDFSVNAIRLNRGHTEDLRLKIAKAQAEISFKAGKEQGYVDGFNAAESTMVSRATKDGRLAGIREVVEWIKPRLDKISELVGNIRGDWTDPRGDCRMIWDILAEIEARLKEWGIDKEAKNEKPFHPGVAEL